MNRQFFSGNTLEQAILAAARHHGLDPERVAYKLRDKKHGFVNIRRRVVIEVDPDAPEQAARPMSESTAVDEQGVSDEWGRGSRQAGDRPERPEPSRPQERHDWVPGGDSGRSEASWRGQEVSWAADEDTVPGHPRHAALERAIDELGELLAMRISPSIRREEGGFEIDLSGPETGALREERGEGLAAIEHLLPRMARGLSGQGVPCRVDSEGFRAAHEDELRRLALSEAEGVRRELEERRLEPMNPADRRVVHLALADDPAVTTESEGRGLFKRVKIMPS